MKRTTLIRTTICAAAVASAGLAATVGVAGADEAPVVAPARPIDRGEIRFRPGADNAAVSGSLARGDWDVWTFWAGEGQHVSIDVTSARHNASFTVTAPNGAIAVADTTSWDTPLDIGGTFRLDVGAIAGQIDYTVTVTITGSLSDPGDGAPAPAPDDGSVRRIEFAPGTSRGSVADRVSGDETDRFVVWGKAGQLMPVWLDSVENNADLSVTDGDGHPIHETIDGFVLPYSGDYYIDVWSDGPESNYTLTVAID